MRTVNENFPGWPFLMGCILYLLLGIEEGSAQIPDFSFRRLSSDEGLTENKYNWFLLRDSREMLWSSSMDGLFRYDGLVLDHYQAGRGKGKTLVDDNIQSPLFETTEGDIWFSTYRALNCYRRNTDSFETFKVDSTLMIDSTLELDNYRIFHLNDSTGQVWLRVDKHLFCFDTFRKEFQRFGDTTEAYSFAVTPSPDGSPAIIYGFLREKTGMDIFSLEADNSWKVKRFWQSSDDSLNDDFPKISSGLIGSDEQLWLLSDKGLLQFDPLTDSLKSFVPSDKSDIEFWCGQFLNDSLLLLGAKKHGLWLFNTRAQQKPFIEHWGTEKEPPLQLPSDEIRSLYLDRHQRLWISYYDIGIEHSPVNFKAQNFQNPFEQLGKTIGRIDFIIEDKNKHIWASTKKDGLYRFSQALDNLSFFPYSDSTKGGLLIEEVQHLTIDPDGNPWILGEHAIYQYKEKRWQEVFRDSEVELNHLFFLENNERIVLTSKGVFDLFGNGAEAKLIQRVEDIFKGRGSHSFIQMYKSVQGDLLVPYKDNELRLGRLEENRIEFLRDSLVEIGAEINQFCENVDSQWIWLSTSEGLKFLDRQRRLVDLKFLKYGPSPLRNSGVYGVLEDQHERLWLSTSAGIFVCHPQDSFYYHYGIKNGMASEDFSKYAALKASDGKMWMGHKKGLVVFHPDWISPYPLAPEPYISRLEIKGALFEGDSIIGEKKRIVLKAHENDLKFEIIAIDYHLSQFSNIEYQIPGYRDGRSIVENGKIIELSKIPPRLKPYKMTYRAINADGIQSTWKTLEIYIRPPLYQRLWFQILTFLLLLALAYAYYRYRIAQIQKEARYKQLIAETETAVLRLQMNPHFLFNSLNSINSLVLQKNTTLAHDYLNRFAHLMRLILDYAAKPLIVLAEEIELLELYLQTEAMRFEDRFEYTINCAAGLDSEEYLIPPMILQPFVENAILHGLSGKTEKGKIILDFWLEGQALYCSVRDNGIGRAAAQKDSRNQSHQSRALEITQRRLELLEHKNKVIPQLQIIDLYDEEQAVGTKVLLRFPLL